MTGTLAILTNIPTPYRVAFFRVLDAEMRADGGRLEVFFCADTEPGRHWTFDPVTRGGTTLPGVSPRIAGVNLHFNPSAPKRIRAANPDWILIAGAWNTPTMLLVSALERGRTPRIFWSEGHADAVLHAGGPIAHARRRVLQSFDGYATPNERSADFVRSQIRGTKPLLHLPNTVDEDLFDPIDVDVEAVRRKYGLPPGARLLVVVAALEPRKRVLESVVAFQRLTTEERRGMHLAVVGTGPQSAMVDELSRSDAQVHLLGQLPGAEVRNVLAAADGFLLASRYDPNPLSVIEAALCGCQLLVTESVGNSDELVGPTGGTIIPDKRSGELISSLGMAIREFAQRSDAEVRECGAATREYARSHYSRRPVARSLMRDLARLWPLG